MNNTENKERAGRAQLDKDKAERKNINAERARAEDLKGQCPLIALGKTGGMKSAYYVRERRDIVTLNPREHIGEYYEDMADLTRWGEWIEPGKDEQLLENERHALWRKVTKELRRMSRNKRFSPANERRIGLWPEVVDGEKGILCNSGAALHFMPSGGGALREVEGVQGDNFYTRGDALPPPAADMATNEEGGAIVEGLRSLTWTFSGAGELVAGWLVCSLLSGHLDVRPNLWITGAAASGKSRVYMILAKLMGWRGTKEKPGYGLTLESLDSSSPGLWQKLGSSLRPIIYDEVEGDGEKKKEADLRKLLAVIRSSATSATATITKGGADGQAVEYMVRCCFLLCSIQARLDKASDRSRIIELPIVEPTQKQKNEMAAKQRALEALANSPDFAGD